MANPLATAGGMFKIALMCLGLAVAACGAAWLDAQDGEIRMRRSGVVRFNDDPGMFKAGLIGNYGIVAIMLATGAFTFALGGLGMQMTRKGSE